MAAHLAGLLREEDRSRPITCAINCVPPFHEGFQTALDVIGLNYAGLWGGYAKLHRAIPTIAMIGSETAPAVSSRGEFFFPFTLDKLKGHVNFQVSSYDICMPAEWASGPDEYFKVMDACPWVAGEFIWSGFDYLGEPCPYLEYTPEIGRAHV
jgi:beta-galactosidase